MSIEENPFTPSFGEIPVYLAGRREIIDACSRAFLSERRRPELTTLFSGARGTGKTALLSYLAELAEQNGWIAVNVTALPGMLDDAEIQLRRNAAHLISPENGLSVASVGIPDPISLSVSEGEAPRSNWRPRMDDMLDQLSPQGIGVLFTVDEVDPTLDEMVQLASFYQHFVREGRKVALLMAGLPHNISSLLNNKTVSFLRRSNRRALDRIPDGEVSAALVRTAQAGNRNVDATALAAAVASMPNRRKVFPPEEALEVVLGGIEGGAFLDEVERKALVDLDELSGDAVEDGANLHLARGHSAAFLKNN